jgi:hypothetical protein
MTAAERPVIKAHVSKKDEESVYPVPTDQDLDDGEEDENPKRCAGEGAEAPEDTTGQQLRKLGGGLFDAD